MDKEAIDLILAIGVFIGIAVFAVIKQDKADMKDVPWYQPYITKKALIGLAVAILTAFILRSFLI